MVIQELRDVVHLIVKDEPSVGFRAVLFHVFPGEARVVIRSVGFLGVDFRVDFLGVRRSSSFSSSFSSSSFSCSFSSSVWHFRCAGVDVSCEVLEYAPGSPHRLVQLRLNELKRKPSLNLSAVGLPQGPVFLLMIVAARGCVQQYSLPDHPLRSIRPSDSAVPKAVVSATQSHSTRASYEQVASRVSYSWSRDQL